VLPRRFARYGLTLHPEKTRLVEFGRAALARAIRAGTKLGTFDFLGLTHNCALSWRGKFTVHVKTMKSAFDGPSRPWPNGAARIGTTPWISNRLSSMRNFAASTTASQRTTAVYGSSIGVSGGAGRSGLNAGRGDSLSARKSTRRSYAAIRCYVRGSYTLGPEQGVKPEEPAGVIPHGGICEGGRPIAPW
jgi:hypothetical protein